MNKLNNKNEIITINDVELGIKEYKKERVVTLGYSKST